MIRMESNPDASIVRLPFVDSTIALSTTVKKGDTHSETATPIKATGQAVVFYMDESKKSVRRTIAP